MSNAIIHIDHLTKTYQKGKVLALDDLSVDIPEGEIFGLIGPDGAGKTSLFRIMTTLLLADKGTVSIDGRDVVKDYKAIRNGIGYMPGRFSLYQDLTVEENLKFFATIFNTTIEENYDLIKDIYQQIEPFRNRPAGKLSGGMKQKLALSCALIHAPRILFLDEPTTGVDPVSRRELWSMLRKLNEAHGITIVASTPYRDEVMLCHRIALMDKGKIQAVGRPEEVLPPEETLHHEVEISEIMQRPLVIEARELVKQFGDFRAVNQISFGVHQGEIFGFLGANGAGKTTAMRILCGLSQPSGGEAYVAGFNCATQYEEIKRRIGYMSQKFSLYEDLTVEENMTLYGGIYGMTRHQIRQKTDEMLTELEAQNIRHSLVGSLPLGWKQKLAFAVSIFHSPDIVFLDEPTGGVDAATRRQFWQLIYRAADRGITVFVTTHYMDEAEYCDRVSIMVDGEIAAMDTPAQLKQNYQKASMYDVFLYLARQAKRT